MRAREHRVLEMAVETGALLGVRRAHKHTDEPTEEQIAEAVKAAVLNEIFEWFELGESEGS